MVCTRKTKTLVSTCVILSGMTNIVCLLYVGWVTNYIASVYVKVQEPISEKKLEEGKEDTLRIIERLDHLENVIKQHIQGTTSLLVPALLSPSPHPAVFYARSPVPSRGVRAACVCAGRGGRAASGEGPLLCPEAAGAPPRLRCVWGCPARGYGPHCRSARAGAAGGKAPSARWEWARGAGRGEHLRISPSSSCVFAVFQNASAVLILLPREPER